MKITIITLVGVSLFLTTGLMAQELPWDESADFTGSGNCASCHTSDGVANTEDGVDISMPTLWRSTMMGNSARDPLWRAKVSAEVDAFPQHQELIETTCTRCHAPMGHEQAMQDGLPGYSISNMAADPLALDGVSCTLCHQIEPDNFGLSESYSGSFLLDDTRLIYGPFTAPLTGPMVNHTDFVPVYSEHIRQSELCATCHTLFTAHVDNEGNLGGSFPEQTPYLEWKNSTFSQDGITCQGCHMPAADSAQDLSTLPPWHSVTRQPYSKHEFVGANEFMLNILKDNADELGLTASAAHFDSTLARTRHMLATRSLNLSADHQLLADTLMVDVTLANLSGHKLPTGIPLRRMWVHLKVVGPDETVVFESGAWNQDGEIIGLDENYEPHHALISEENQVQIYEGVMADVDDAVTHTLLRASHYLKDNRLPPMGFLSSHSAYDSTAIEGLALDDADFNHSAGVEGSGADTVHYKIPVTGQGPFEVEVDVCYQTLTPRMFQDLLNHDTPEVQTFAPMYEAADKTPSLLGQLTLVVEAASGLEQGSLPHPLHLNQNVPNPFNPATVISYEIDAAQPVRLEVFDLSGQLVRQLVSGIRSEGQHRVTWNGTDDRGEAVASGVYFYHLNAGEQQASRRMTLVR